MTTTTEFSFRLGEPQITGPLAVYPVFGPRARTRYRGLVRAIKHGARVTETPQGEVNQVLLQNPTDQAVLLYEGELILGAAQNRTIDQPVLVPAGTELAVPVSCVEAGRWDVGVPGAAFKPSPDLVDPALRAIKRGQANCNPEGRPRQDAVWHEIGERLVAAGVRSNSEAFTDIFEARRGEVDGLADPIELVKDQIGALAAVNGRPVALDIVGRRRVFAELHPRLVHGYALQAIDARGPRPGGAQLSPEDLLGAALGSGWRWLPNPGMGDSYAPDDARVDGCCLRVGRELIALSAFPAAR
jgi:hypothetical protein